MRFCLITYLAKPSLLNHYWARRIQLFTEDSLFRSDTQSPSKSLQTPLVNLVRDIMTLLTSNSLKKPNFENQAQRASKDYVMCVLKRIFSVIHLHTRQPKQSLVFRFALLKFYLVLLVCLMTRFCSNCPIENSDQQSGSKHGWSSLQSSSTSSR